MDLLQSVAGENVSWRQPGRKPRTFRLWTDNDHYKIVTRSARFLLYAGLIQCQMAAGYTFTTRGYCELTPEGRIFLKLLLPSLGGGSE